MCYIHRDDAVNARIDMHVGYGRVGRHHQNKHLRVSKAVVLSQNAKFLLRCLLQEVWGFPVMESRLA
jgi:hypothetical protein